MLYCTIKSKAVPDVSTGHVDAGSQLGRAFALLVLLLVVAGGNGPVVAVRTFGEPREIDVVVVHEAQRLSALHQTHLLHSLDDLHCVLPRRMQINKSVENKCNK